MFTSLLYQYELAARMGPGRARRTVRPARLSSPRLVQTEVRA